jgi:hypothetical protein
MSSGRSLSEKIDLNASNRRASRPRRRKNQQNYEFRGFERLIFDATKYRSLYEISQWNNEIS